MCKAPSKLLVILLMFFALVGQTLAAQLIDTCEEPNRSNSSVIVNDPHRVNIDIISHVNQTAECCSIACCDLDCACAANTCSPFMYVYANEIFTHVKLCAKSFGFSEISQPTIIISLLYRPPIFTA